MLGPWLPVTHDSRTRVLPLTAELLNAIQTDGDAVQVLVASVGHAFPV